MNNFVSVVSEQHLYGHTERIQCLEVTHSPEADIVAFHIPPTVTMSCRLFPSEAVESLLLCACRQQWNLESFNHNSVCAFSMVLLQYSPYAAFVGGECPGEFRKRRNGICLPVAITSPRFS